jgi:hypothetical protein
MFNKKVWHGNFTVDAHAHYRIEAHALIADRLRPRQSMHAVNMTFCGLARDTVLNNRQTEKWNFDRFKLHRKLF